VNPKADFPCGRKSALRVAVKGSSGRLKFELMRRRLMWVAHGFLDLLIKTAVIRVVELKTSCIDTSSGMCVDYVTSAGGESQDPNRVVVAAPGYP
jgi:hypothetical protein